MLNQIKQVMPLKQTDVDVVILCGGKGTRLNEVVNDRPKPMAEINGRSFLDILIGYVSCFGFKRVILSVCYMADYIKDYYRNKRFPCEILFSQENEPLGTGGAVKQAENSVQSNPFLVLNGDSFCPVDLSQFLDFHLKKNAFVSMVVTESEDVKDFGTICLDDSQKIVRFEEKKGRGKSFINAGIYLFEKEVFSLIPSNVRYSLEHDLFPTLVDQKFYGYVTQEKLIDIGTPERYELAKRILRHEDNHVGAR